MGFKKLRAPPELWNLIEDFWKKNKDNRKLEQWGTGNTYTNNWASPTYMVSVEDTGLRGGGSKLKQAIWDEAAETVAIWTESLLTQCSLYGIRIYTAGAVLATHVDRLPLVSSAIINVAQDVDEPWPLEVIGHDGKAYNVTMEPGDMVSIGYACLQMNLIWKASHLLVYFRFYTKVTLSSTAALTRSRAASWPTSSCKCISWRRNTFELACGCLCFLIVFFGGADTLNRRDTRYVMLVSTSTKTLTN